MAEFTLEDPLTISTCFICTHIGSFNKVIGMQTFFPDQSAS